mgnify:CR=1 FL=1
MPLFRPQLHANLTDVTSAQHHARAHDHSNASDGATLSPAAGINFSSVITPAALSASVNNYAPNGGDAAFLWRLNPNGGAYNITGIVAPAVAGAMHWITCLAGTSITLTHADAASSAVNRFNLPSAANIAMGGFDNVLIIYDGTAQRWKAIASL